MTTRKPNKWNRWKNNLLPQWKQIKMVFRRMERDRLFLQGIGSLLDISPRPVRLHFKADQRSDSEKIRGDFQKVGHDIQQAMDSLDSNVKK